MLLLLHSFAYAVAPVTNPSPGYLIVLVHGINTTHRVFIGNGEKGSDITGIPKEERYSFGDLKGYLENTLGLKGYVYAYTFSERDGKIPLEGKELGDPNWNNMASTIGGTLHLGSVGRSIDNKATGITKGNSWLKQAREDFIDWFKDKKRNPNNPTGRPPIEAEIPSKYIIIAHSLGGLAARSFLSSEYYEGDGENNGVIALISITSQNNGSESALALKKISEFYQNHKYIESMASMFALVFVALAADQDEIATYCGVSGFLMAYGRFIGDIFIEDALGWYPEQPGVQDVDSSGEFIRQLNNKRFVKDNRPLKVRFISCDGIPTPSGNLSGNRYFLGLSAIQTILSSSYINDLPLGAKIMSIYLSEVMGTVMDQNGDLYSSKKSQEGDGLTALYSPNISFRKYSIRSGNDWGALSDAMIGLSGALAGVAVFTPIKAAQIPTKLALIFAFSQWASNAMQDRVKEYVYGHGLILKWVYEQGVIDHALEDIILVGGQSAAVSSSSSRSGISAASVRSTTAGYTAPEQAFSLLSNKNRDGTDAPDYHSVTIEAITESNNHPQSAPIVFDGQKKWVSGVTVKDAPTALKGVINTFLPKKLKSFEYSENFAAWKPVGAVDKWGNFTVKDLNFAEGQNVISFKAESWIGNKMNQILNITLNTIPMLPSGFSPAPNSYTNNNRPRIGATFAKAAYSASPLENISIDTAKIIFPDGSESNIKDEPGFKFTISGGDYDKHGEIEYIPPSPLPDGFYTVLIVVNSNVGKAQALWPFMVDTTPPTVKFLPSR
ncbi:hypothetical protein HZC35_02900 [Candidatus Saganbacteria bacterium]|nr:hypothetical protein [Candidatus Saganbacteria bacterium]